MFQELARLNQEFQKEDKFQSDKFLLLLNKKEYLFLFDKEKKQNIIIKSNKKKNHFLF